MAKKTKSKPTDTLTRCRDCKLAYLMQHRQDPIVAECRHTKERYVASTRKKCEPFVRRTTEEKINPMIKLK